jgi:methionine synthase II (cobalamin-independent)
MAWQLADPYILGAHAKSFLKAQMKIPAEPIESIPKPLELLDGIAKAGDHAGVVSPIDPGVDTPEEVRDRMLEAAKYVVIEQLGMTDDCGFSPFSDDSSTTREPAFAKVRARAEGTGLAERIVGNG